MNFKKVIAVFAVLVMALASVTAIVAYTPESESAALPDNGTVVLDISKGWDANAKELFKLGITNPSYWTKTDDGYKITMDNVKYQTSRDSPAILVFGNGILTFDCRGTNEITCSGIDDDGICAGIVSGMADDAGLRFTGNGVMKVTCSYPDPFGSAAISTLNLEVTGGCTLLANGSDVKPSLLTQTNTVGINVENKGNVTITDGATVIAKGGDATVEDGCLGIISAGIFGIEQNSTYKVKVENSVFYAIGGTIKAKDLPHADSVGAMLSGGIDVTNSTICFYGGSVEVGDANIAKSNGMTIHGTMNAKNSRIVGVSEDVSAGSKFIDTNPFIAESIGLEWAATSERTFNAENCDCYIISGSCTTVEKPSENVIQISAGLAILKTAQSTNFTLNLKGTIFDIEADTAEFSYGFLTYNEEKQEVTLEGKINLDDSDIWAYGEDQAISGTIKVTGNPLWSGKSNDTTKWYGFDPKKPDEYKYKYISVGFKRNVYLSSVDEGLPQVSSYRIDGNTFTLPECDFLAPEGKQFKCWSIDGEEYQPGETVEMGAKDYYLVVNAEWENIPVPEPVADTNCAPIIICIVAFTLVIIALIGVILYERH